MLYPDHQLDNNSAYAATMMSLRPLLDPYRSLPTTPLGMDPRSVSSMDINSAMAHARLGLEVQDYFSGSPRFSGNLRPRSPYPHDCDSDGGAAYTSANASYGASSDASNPVNLANLVCRFVCVPFILPHIKILSALNPKPTTLLTPDLLYLEPTLRPPSPTRRSAPRPSMARCSHT